MPAGSVAPGPALILPSMMSEGEQTARTARAIAQICSLFPRFQKFIGRIYDIPGGIHSIVAIKNALTLGLHTSITQTDVRSQDDIAANSFAAVALMSNLYDFPFWVMPKKMVDVIQNIDPPEQWSTSSMVMGFPSMYFLLPRGTLFGDEGEEIACVGVSYYNSEVQQKLKGDGVHVQLKDPQSKKDVMTFIALGVNGEMWGIAIPIPESEVISENDVLKLSEESSTGEMAHWQFRVLIPFVMTALAIMSARPEISDRDETVKKRAKKGRREVVLPRIFGKNYKTPDQRTSGDNTVSKVATHWRRGHMRQQRHGQGNLQIKQILIDPVMINPP
jgi:hypothetical protein